MGWRFNTILYFYLSLFYLTLIEFFLIFFLTFFFNFFFNVVYIKFSQLLGPALTSNAYYLPTNVLPQSPLIPAIAESWIEQSIVTDLWGRIKLSGLAHICIPI